MQSYDFNEFLFMTSIYLFLTGINWWRHRSIFLAAQPLENAWILGKREYLFSIQGIKIIGPNFSYSILWSAVRKIENSNHLIILMVDSAQDILLPKRHLEDPEKALNLLEELFRESA
ncbi:MAG: YcxB family protein [Cyanobacteria bacterium J06626_4]